MAEIVNLRQARKARARAGNATKADANRAAFGRSKAEKAAAKVEIARRERDLDRTKLDS